MAFVRFCLIVPFLYPVAVVLSLSIGVNMTPPSIHNIPRHGISRLSTEPRLNMPRRMKHRHSLKKQCLTIQKVTRSVLYYARAVDPTVLMPLNDIAMGQTKATEKRKPPRINCWII
jgi:hypothetical protein